MTGNYVADDNKLRAKQLMAMQRIDDSVRAGLVTAEEARPLEHMVRSDMVPGALKRLSEIRRGRKPAPKHLD